MGRNPISEPYRDDPDSVSLHTTPGDYDDDAPQLSDEVPPSYADSEPSTGVSDAILTPTSTVFPATRDNGAHQEFLGTPINVVKGVTNMMDSRCDSDPDYLERKIKALSTLPPSPQIHIVGTHRETHVRNNKKETEQITDFRITLDMTSYIFKDFAGNNDQGRAWVDLRTVENGVKTHRGTIMKSRAPGYKQDLEVGAPKPTLTEWCHRYCAAHSPLKVFRLTRTVAGMDELHLKNRIEGLVRSTGYRGHLSITFPVENRATDIYSSGRINSWRLTTWIRWIFYLTLLFLFVWPYLFIRTKRFAVVEVMWPFAKVDAYGNKQYATITEEQWFVKFADGLKQLVLDRYQGDASDEYLEQVMSRPRRADGRPSTGHEGVDSALSIISGGIRAAENVNRFMRFGVGGNQQEGWGYDT
jgi:hypothetical protein